MKLQSTSDQTRSIDTNPLVGGEKTINEVDLTLLETFCPKWHLTKIGNHILGIPQSQMTQESFIVFIDIILNHGIELLTLTIDNLLESGDYLLKKRFIEHQMPTMHDKFDIITLKQIACLQNNTISPCIEDLNP